MQDNLIKILKKEHEDYLRDESRKTGHADSISFPKNEKEIMDILLTLNKTETLITTQGARTGIAAGAIPQGGHILNLMKMNKITGLRYDKATETFYLKVQPGVLLTEIREVLKTKDFDTKDWSHDSLDALKVFKNSTSYFFSPDPTESTASIGGMAACNASGACSFKYGPTRNYIEALRVILVNGNAISLKRGETKASGTQFSIKTDTDDIIQGNIPTYSMPKVKNASGYYCIPNMDLLDLFIGSDGTLGIISELEIKLLKSPSYVYGLTAFFSDESKSLDFVENIRENSSPAAVEFFNNTALDLLRKEKQTNKAFAKLLDLPSHFNTAVYIEYHCDNEIDAKNMIFNAGDTIKECGGNEEDTWLATTPSAKEQLHVFRHALPEAVNLLIDEKRKKDSRITKLGTDMAVPDSKLKEVMNIYVETLKKENLNYVIFGHIGNNHVHVNILPNNMDEYNKGKTVYSIWAEKIISMGGTISAEHGVGKLKINLLEKMFGKQSISEMKLLKQTFDPKNRLNKGNLFEW